MKLRTKSIITLIAMLLGGIGQVAAGEDNTPPVKSIIYLLDGKSSTESAAGSITTETELNGDVFKVTLTVTPVTGKTYIEKDNIKVTRTVSGEKAQTRENEPEIDNEPVELTAVDSEADPTGVTKYYFTFSTVANSRGYWNNVEYEYDYEVTADFQSLIDITNATVTLEETSFAYTGEEIKPTVSSVVLGEETIAAENYEVSYNDYIIEPAEATSDNAPTVIVTATKLPYTGDVSKKFTITKATPELKFSKETATATMNAEFEAPTLTVTPEGLEGITYSSSNTNAATIDEDGKVTIVGAGETTIKATFAEDEHYEAAEASYVLTVNATMTVSAEGFEGVYDGKAHNITVTVTTPAEGAVVKYGTTEDTYNLTENPTYTEAGTYTVYYQVTKDGYETTTGSATVKISKATPTVTAPTAKENLTYTGEAQELINAGSTTGGEMQYSLDNETYSTNIPTGTEAKKYTVYYKVVGGTNYEDVTAASIEVTISETALEKMTVSAEGFEGTYDKESHSINVTVTTPAEGAVVKYGTTEGVYDHTENPAYTEAGTYTVYYQVTKDGYETTTGSATVKINKATPTVTAPTAKQGLTYTGEAQELINAGSTTGGEMQYSLDNKTYSTSIPTGTEAKKYTVYYKVVGGTNYEDVAAASIEVIINEAVEDGYPLWVNGIQVTRSNWQDILGNDKNPEIPRYIFNSEKKQLLIDHDQTGTTVIESRMDDLYIYLMDVSKIDHIFFNNTGDTSNKGTLTFTTNGNFPGKLVLTNSTKGESAITGFSEINYKWNLVALEPDGVDYNTTTLQMEYKEKDKDGKETGSILVADNITISQAIVPITEKKAIRFEGSQLVEKDEDGNVKLDEKGDPIPADLSNYPYAPSTKSGEPEKNVVLINLNPANIDDLAGGFGTEDGFSGIYIGDTMTDAQAGQVANDVDNQNMVPGGSTYAENYDGFTFMLPAGYGIVDIDDIVEDDYEFHLIIGTDDPITLDDSNSTISRLGDGLRVQSEIHFNVKEPVYCYLYLVQKTAGTRGIGGTRLGKREKAHGKLISLSVSVTRSIPTDPPSEASGGELDKDDDPEVEEANPTPPTPTPPVTGIETVNSHEATVNSGWYTIKGQQIETPTQKGIYIQNRKKIIIK